MLRLTFALLALSAASCATAATKPVAPARTSGAAALEARPAAAAVSPEKQALVARVLAKIPMENVGLAMLQAPVAESLRQARSLLQGRTTPEKQDAAMKEINGEAAKFMEDAGPLVRARTNVEIGALIAPLLAQRFTEEELRQLVALLESPVKAKFEALVPEIQKTLGEKVSADLKEQINPKLADLQQRIGLRMRSAIAP